MSGTAEVLQEYLVKLGFQSDAVSLKKFEDGLGGAGKRVLGVGVAVAGVVAGVEAATAAFAYNMRQMYFNSQLAGSSVDNLQAMDYATKQFGISQEETNSTIENLGVKLRLMPQLKGLMEHQFGVKVTGRDTTDVLNDFIKKTKGMIKSGIITEQQGAMYANLFGIDEKTYLRYLDHIDGIIAKKKEAQKAQKAAGYDPKAAEKAIKDYTAAIDELLFKLGNLEKVISIKLVEPFKKATARINETIDALIRLTSAKDFSGFRTVLKEEIKDFSVGEQKKARERGNDFKDFMGGLFNLIIPGASSTPALPGASSTPALPGASSTPALPGANNTTNKNTSLSSINNTRLAPSSTSNTSNVTINAPITVHGNDAPKAAKAAVGALTDNAKQIVRNNGVNTF
jgi:hypothetical protein